MHKPTMRAPAWMAGWVARCVTYLLACCVALGVSNGLALAAHPSPFTAPFTVLDRTTAKQLMDPASHRQPTVVVLWSSECSHCKKNLQLLAKLVPRMQPLQVITVAVEPPSPGLGPMLDRYRLAGARYAYGSDTPDALAYSLDPNWAGELPRTYVFNGTGRKEGVSGVISEAFLANALWRK